ncbi:MAG: hypothetical protein AAF824_20925 [Bacteroidota bacterium]
MTQVELIQTVQSLPLQDARQLLEVLQHRFTSLTDDELAELQGGNPLTYIPTQEESEKLDQLLSAHEQGELSFQPLNEAMAELRTRK